MAENFQPITYRWPHQSTPGRLQKIYHWLRSKNQVYPLPIRSAQAAAIG